MPSLYALLVGIDNYQHENVPDLKSCKLDVLNIETFLKRCDPNLFDLRIIKITDEEASKSGIVEALCSILETLQDDDSFIWYYSGHGCREFADEVWRNADGNRDLECLVCSDFDFIGNGCLADKEIRFIFHRFLQNSKAEVITIFDSCHSGDATRSDLIPKRLDSIVNKRAWNQFEFGKDLSRDLLKNSDLDTLLPLTKHFHIASCRDTELAYQSTTGSILTNTLIRVCEQSDIAITYNDLENRLINSVRNNYSQMPNIEAIGYDSGAKNTLFIKGGIIGKSNRYDVFYSKEEGSWQLNLGRIHGLSTSIGEKINISTLNGTSVMTGEVEDVFLTKTTLSFENEQDLDKNQTYAAEIKGLYKEKTYVFLQGNPWGKEVFSSFINENKVDIEQHLNLQIVDDISLANFSIYALKKVDKYNVSTKSYLITPPILYDDSNLENLISFSDEIFDFNEESVEKVISNLRKVAHWKYVLSINNYSNFNDDIQMFLVKKNGDTSELKEKNHLNLLNGDEIRFEIQNNSDDKLFIKSFLINQSFGIHPLIDTANSIFEGNSKKNVPRDKFLRVKSKFPQLPYETVWIKVFFATEEINLTNFEQPDLINSRSSTSVKGKDEDANENSQFSVIDESWGTLTFELRASINPPTA